jgi:hypothetical protein
VAKTATVAAVLPIGRAAVFVARQVGGACAVEAAPAHRRKPVRSCFVRAVAGRVDTRCVNLHRDVDYRVRLDVLGRVFVTLTAAVPVILLLLKVKLSNDALELRKVGGVCRAVGQALLKRLVEARVVKLLQGTVVVAALLLVLLKARAVLCGSALALANFVQLCTRQLLHANDQEVFLECLHRVILLSLNGVVPFPISLWYGVAQLPASPSIKDRNKPIHWLSFLIMTS